MASTIKDVAKLAKVSIASVSKALNGEKGVGAETRERIMNAAKILGYAPNARAVSFSRQEAHAILFVYRSYPDDPFTNPYVYSLFEAILESLTESHYRFAALNVNNLANPSETVKSLMAGKAYDGAIIHANALDKELLAQIRLNKFPAILIGRDKYVNWLDTNHVLAGRAAASYLLNRGYARFAFIGPSKEDDISSGRLEGLLLGLSEHGIELAPSLVERADGSFPSVDAAVGRLLSLAERPEVIVASNNVIVYGVSRSLERRKISVPSEVSYLTFDAYPYAGIAYPRATSIIINVQELGHEVARQMIRLIGNRSYGIQSFVTVPSVKVGESTR